MQEIATEEYIKHYNPQFKGLPTIVRNPLTTKERNSFLATAVNNRAAILQIKIFDASFDKVAPVQVNTQIAKLRTSMLQQAYDLDPDSIYVQLNGLFD